MKKIVPTIVVVALFTLIFLFCFHSCVSASDIISEEVEEKEAIEEFDKEALAEYIKEKIVPVVVGVLTSGSALVATLATIKRSLNKIALAREEFKNEAKERKDSFKRESEYLSTKTEELAKICGEIPRLQAQLELLKENSEKLAKENGYIAKMISLGFSQNKQIIASGNGKKINRLLEECSKLFKKENVGKTDTDKDILSEEKV